MYTKIFFTFAPHFGHPSFVSYYKQVVSLKQIFQEGTMKKIVLFVLLAMAAGCILSAQTAVPTTTITDKMPQKTA